MTTNWVHGPMLAFICLFICVWLITAVRRIRAVKNNQLSIKAVQNLIHDEMPTPALLPGRNYDNLMQQPILFFILLTLFLYNEFTELSWQIGAWSFVILRIWHSIEHIRATNIKRRTLAFGLASSCLWILWLSYLATMFAYP